MSSGVFFTSDQHFGHRNIIDFCKRPFKDVSDMREQLISRHNSVVKPGDRVYILGDMFWRTTSIEDALSIRHSMNGQLYYIRGNHEELIDKHAELRNSFIWCKDVENLKITGYPNIWLSHYAHEDWNGSHNGSYHLFGHVHGQKPKPVGLKLDVGVDCWDYYPVSLEKVTEILAEKAEKTVHRFWSCNNVECKNRFNAIDRALKICSKCGTDMKLMSRFEESRP